ncbi:ATP synthase F1, epsilon subunit [Campylobacter ureolyticus ACS-301-V-Sch3b]|uniref:ATP synthase epsilon chain n=1 Tax=Campylobacter ureolyticus ACS-301-V-Sch3b TaxID=883165 RepID=S3X9F5_9BACT|nr:ATP synthase F1 subunit epsilon [Campylobacter ureolyticus]EPH07464.1 ATP synthase F1, epsilon subunit [Campylobacter ureolyticus ACS-301-V-Sch3b]
MKDKFQLEIVTPKGTIFSGEVKSAQFPGSEGELGVLPSHAPLITLLNTGLIELVDENNEKDMVAINWGYLKVDEEKVTVLADGAVYVGGKSDSSIAESLDKAKELIESMGSENVTYASTIAKMENMARSK